METLFLKNTEEDIARAGEILRRGGLVAIPTETVYGLAANALDEKAVASIYAAKGRPSDNPLIVHISHISQLAALVREVPESAKKLAEVFWPGPLTIILPKSHIIPHATSGGLDTVAVRFPSHPVAQAVITAAGVPLAAPSANISGRPSPTAFAHVVQDLTGRVDALLDGGDCAVGVESTVITLAEGTPRVLRPGGITVSRLRKVLGKVEVDPAVAHKMQEGEKAHSPGMKYKHYSPAAEVEIVDSSPEEYIEYVNKKGEGRKDVFALCFDEDKDLLSVPWVSYGGRYDSQEQAHLLFGALHGLDEAGAKQVYARMPRKTGMGLAVYNRLIRAAGFKVYNPYGHHIIGLIGHSGAGKSTVARLLEEGGCRIVDCDDISRRPQVYNQECIKDLQEAFGEDVAENGVLNRKLVARRAFATPEGKELLQNITFPHILKVTEQELKEAEKDGEKLIILDAPTLFEAGMDKVCSRILAVTAPEESRLKRIMARDGIDEQGVKLRFAAQPEESFYTGRADYVIVNDGRTVLPEAVRAIVAALRDEIKETGA